MRDIDKTKEQLIDELAGLRHRITQLEASEAELKRVEEELRKHRQRLEELGEERTAGLKKAQERFSGVFDSSKDAIGYATLEGVMVDVNDSFCKLTGYSREELLARRKHQDLTPAEYQEYEAKTIEEVLRTGEPAEYEKEYMRKDGSRVPVLLTAFVVKGNDGKPIGLAGIAKDITDRKKAEERLKAYSERLEEMVEERTEELKDAQEQLVQKEKLAVLGQLAGGVGHELRNPLAVISNAVYFLKMKLSEADETSREYLEMIGSEVGNAHKIVSDLLDFSRTRLVEREEAAVSHLVAEVLEKRPPPENVEVTTEIASDLPPVFVDDRQIGQVLVNLLTNAYQAMPEGGKLTISAKGEKEEVHLSVADTGCGISKDNMEKLFQPLFSTKARGIGLGLAVSRNLVEANGGSIKVESEEGKGSTFTLILPTKEVAS